MSMTLRRSKRHSAGRPTAAPAVATPSRTYINRLPDELFRDIFIFYSENGYGETLSLMLVCKAWYNVVHSTTALWSKICFGPAKLLEMLEVVINNKMKTYSLCSSPQKVARAIQRLGPAASFDFVCCLVPDLVPIDDAYWEGIESSWFERCKTLALLVQGPLADLPHPFRNLKLLEECLLTDVDGSFTELLTDIQENSPKLRELYVQSPTPYGLNLYPDLLGRLKTLSIDPEMTDCESLSQIFKKVTSLTSMTLDQICRVDGDYSSYTVGSQALSEMVLNNSSYAIFHSSTYQHLTLLEIIVNEKRFLGGATSCVEITMPVLEGLTLDGMWSPIKTITAPRLRTLRLRRCLESPQDRLDALLSTGLRPSILRINGSIADSDLVAAFRNSFAKIEELHLILGSMNAYLRPRLINELSGIFGKVRKAPLCPSVWCFSVLSVMPTKDHMDRVESTKAGAKQIAEGRQQLGNLKVLRCGWVPWGDEIRTKRWRSGRGKNGWTLCSVYSQSGRIRTKR